MSLEHFLTNQETFETVPGQPLRFKECNLCIDGMIFNPYKREETECKYCSDKRKRLDKLNTENAAEARKALKEDLNLPDSLGAGTYNPDDIFLKVEQNKSLDPSYVYSFTQELVTVEKTIRNGCSLEHSYLFCFNTPHVYLNDYITTLMTGAYSAGISTSPYTRLKDIVAMNSSYMEKGYMSDRYKKLFEADLLVVSIGACYDKNALEVLKELMEERANNKKPTIIFASNWNPVLYDVSDISSIKTDTGIAEFATAKLYIPKEKTVNKQDMTSEKWEELIHG